MSSHAPNIPERRRAWRTDSDDPLDLEDERLDDVDSNGDSNDTPRDETPNGDLGDDSRSPDANLDDDARVNDDPDDRPEATNDEPIPSVASDMGRFVFTLVDQTKDVKQAAKDRAEARLVEELNAEGGKVRKFLRNVWKGNMAREIYRQRYIREAESEIVEQQDILIHSESDATRRQKAMESTIERYQHEAEDVIHRDAGETREDFTGSELADKFKTLIKDYADGKINEAALVEEKKRILSESDSGNSSTPSKVRIDNLVAIAESVKSAVHHGESVDNIVDNMKFITGEAKSSVRTTGKEARIDKVVENINKSRFGILASPEVVATCVGVAATVAKLTTTKAAIMAGGVGVGTGLLTAYREDKKVKNERTQHAREMAMGGEIDPEDERRIEMQEATYNVINVNDLVDGLVNSTQNVNQATDLEAKKTTAHEALAMIVAAKARKELSNARNMDLISYSSASEVSAERFKLDITLLRAKQEIAAALNDTDLRRELGISDDNLSIDEIIEARQQAYEAAIEQDIEEKDKKFRSLRARRVIVAGLAGAATGAVIGIASQEIVASFDSTRFGLLERAWGGNNQLGLEGDSHHQTLLESALHGTERENVIFHETGSSINTMSIDGSSSAMGVTDDHSLEIIDGKLKLTDGAGNVTVEGLSINDDGSLPEASRNALESMGMTIGEDEFVVDNFISKDVSIEEYLSNHEGDGNRTMVSRQFWYDNNTAAFDKNELGIWNGGENYSGINADGTYQYTLAGMAEGGSSHNGHSVSWSSLAEQGNLKLAVSATADSQSNVFMVDINPDGTANIDPNSPVGKFFENNNGQLQFNGKYAEVVEIAGQNDSGAQIIRPLATEVGRDSLQTITDSVNEPITAFKTEITTAGYSEIQKVGMDTEFPIGPPIITRREMRSLIRRSRGGYYNGYNSYSSNVEENDRRKKYFSPDILANPNARLNPHKELQWYSDTVKNRDGEAYFKEINATIDNIPELNLNPVNSQNGKSPLSSVIVMPVNAAGDVESNNIYNLLKAYSQQDDKEALGSTTMLLHVNWFDDLMNDPASSDKIAKTKAEIARAKKDFPDLNIATMETEWEREKVKDGVIGHVAKKMYDVAMMAVKRNMDSGAIPRDEDVVVIRNDADAKGVSKTYMKRMLGIFRKNPDTDVFKGATKFDHTKTDLPGLMFASNFMQTMSLVGSTRGASKGRAHTGGANAGIRLSTLAATGGLFLNGESGAGSDDVSLGRSIELARAMSDGSNISGGYGSNSSGYVNNNSNSAQSTRQVQKVVGGAIIDTDSNREEALYRRGVPIIQTWNPEFGFDDNGFRDRDSHLNNSAAITEVIGKNTKEIIERIRNDMEGTIRDFDDAVTTEISLAHVFKRTGDPSKCYILGRSSNGEITFKLTRRGRRAIKDQLTRDHKGRRSDYGVRRRSVFYNRGHRAALNTV